LIDADRFLSAAPPEGILRRRCEGTGARAVRLPSITARAIAARVPARSDPSLPPPFAFSGFISPTVASSKRGDSPRFAARRARTNSTPTGITEITVIARRTSLKFSCTTSRPPNDHFAVETASHDAFEGGDVVTGMIVTKTDEAATLRQARGAERTIRRADMPSMRANGLSMMPEELEVGPDPQGMANLLAYHQTPRQVISGSSVL
jgi:hypothetical protein